MWIMQPGVRECQCPMSGHWDSPASRFHRSLASPPFDIHAPESGEDKEFKAYRTPKL